MTGAEFKAIRTGLSCTAPTFARALGYDGTTQTLKSHIWKFENGQRKIPPATARLAAMFRDHGIPKRMSGDTVARLVDMVRAHA